MKRLLLLIMIFLTLGIGQSYAWWTYLENRGTPVASYYQGDYLQYIFNFAVNQDTWGWSVTYGLGTSTDGTGWTWRDAEYSYQTGNDRYWKSKAGEHQFTSTGSWYYSGRFFNGSITEYASDNWAENRTTLDATSYFSVSALSNPSGVSATAAGSSSVDLAWTAWNGKYVMVVRKKSTESWTEPTQGTAYSAGNTIGSGVVVYIGPATSYTNTGLTSSTQYDYKFYSENNGYYSAGTVASATTQSAASDHFRSKATGNWSASTSWETSYNNSFWANATLSPGSGAASVTVLNGHTITVTGAEAAGALTINNGGILKINPLKSLSVTGTLTNSAGNGGLVIESDATGTGALIHNSASVAATVERYFPGASQSWHLLSAPVASQAIDPEFTATNASDYDFFAWHEPAATWVNFKNTTVEPTWNTANGSTNFTPGKGYLVEYLATNPTKQFTGSLNNGAVSLAMTTGGSGTYTAYNLTGNPYPSPIDWKASSGWTRSFVVTSGVGYDMSIWNDAAGQYGSYNSASLSDDGTNSVGRYIPVGQGFMVKASGAGSLGMDNGIRVTNDATFLKSQTTVVNTLRMKLAGEVNTYRDEVVVEFGHTDNSGGAVKMFSFYETAPSLYTVKDQMNYAIDFRGDLSSQSIPLYFKAGETGTYTLTASQTENFAQGTAIRLEDLQSGHTQDLTVTPAYSFTASTGDHAARFLLHFGNASGIGGPGQGTVHIATDRHTLLISGAAAGGSVTVYNILGQAILQQELTAPVTRLRIHAPDGYYIVRVTAGRENVTGKVFIHQ